MHADVIYKFVFGFKGLALARTLLPEADVVGLLRAADVLHCDVRDQLVHGAESFGAEEPGRGALRSQPLADELLFDGLAHVAEEGAGTVGRGEVHGQVHAPVAVQGRGSGQGVAAGHGSRREGFGPRVHFSGEPQTQESVQSAAGGGLGRLFLKARDHRGAGGGSKLGAMVSEATTCCRDKQRE